MNYYESELNRLNTSSDQISIKLYDGQGGQTKQLDLNDESIKSLIIFLEGRIKHPAIEFTRVNSDVNGNPRYVVHFLCFYKNGIGNLSINEAYAKAVKAANKIGGKKYHTKSYSGGIVFQSYNIDRLKELITENQI